MAELGHDVRVVAPSVSLELAERDRRLVEARGWRLQQVHLTTRTFSGRISSIHLRARRCAAAAAYSWVKRSGLAEYAMATAGPELAALAASEPADWFIAHTQPVLPAAAAAAHKRNARLGFDCEDLLTRLEGAGSVEMISAIEKRYMPVCDYVSTPSPAISECLQQEYGIDSIVLYNVFPLHLANKLVPPCQRNRNSSVRLHWVGQTVGHGKGIEEAFEAVALLGRDVELHIRGKLAAGHESFIRDLEHRFQISVKMHPLVHHDDLVNAMGQFDIGLALERPGDDSPALTVTNKVFLYLLSGMAIAATDTSGQRTILEQVPSAGFLYTAGHPEILAGRLRQWVDNRQQLMAAQQASWRIARTRFCWDIEKENFLSQVLGQARPTLQMREQILNENA